MNPFVELDHSLFMFFNKTLSNPVFDFIMPIVTDSNNLLYFTGFCLILYGVLSKNRKVAALSIVFALLTFAATDLITYRLLKPMFGRFRPCNPSYFVDGVHTFLTGANFWGTKVSLSLPSNHATNMFGQAVFWTFLFPRWWKVFIPFATLVCYSRVYLGVHYPFDLFLGAIIGGLIGWFFVWARGAVQKRFLHS